MLPAGFHRLGVRVGQVYRFRTAEVWTARRLIVLVIREKVMQVVHDQVPLRQLNSIGWQVVLPQTCLQQVSTM
jgi:hypothetical protein